MNAISLIRFVCGGRRREQRRSRQSSSSDSLNSSWEGYLDQTDLSGEQQQPCDRDSDDSLKPSRRHTIATIDDRCLPEFKLQYDASIFQELEQMEQEIQNVARRQQKEHESK